MLRFCISIFRLCTSSVKLDNDNCRTYLLVILKYPRLWKCFEKCNVRCKYKVFYFCLHTDFKISVLTWYILAIEQYLWATMCVCEIHTHTHIFFFIGSKIYFKENITDSVKIHWVLLPNLISPFLRSNQYPELGVYHFHTLKKTFIMYIWS